VTALEVLAWVVAGVFALVAALSLTLFLLNERTVHRLQTRCAELRIDLADRASTEQELREDLADRAAELAGVRKQLRESQDRGIVLAETVHQTRARLWQLEQEHAGCEFAQGDTTEVFDDLMRTAFFTDEEPS
jgi:septal ring factor EnvC (AmiA/AmiB activator)